MRSDGKSAKLQGAVYASFAAFLALLALAAYRHPVYSWDPVAYMGVVRNTQTSDARAIQTYAYSRLDAATHTRFFDHGGAFFQEMHDNPEHFVEVLSFYSIRPLYILLLQGCARAGIEPLAAARAISALSLLGIGVIVLLWMRRYLGAWSAAFTALLLLWPPVLTPLREPLPDGLTGFLIVASLYAVFECECVFPGLILAALAMLVRSDAVVLFAALVMVLAGLGRIRKPHAATLLAVAAFVALLIERVAAHPGWTTLMHNTFIEPLSNPLEVRYGFGARDYLAAVGKLCKEVVQLDPGPVACLLMSLAALLRSKSPSAKAALAVLLAATLARLALFPSWQDRFFISLYVISGIGLAAALAAPKAETGSAEIEGAVAEEKEVAAMAEV